MRRFFVLLWLALLVSAPNVIRAQAPSKVPPAGDLIVRAGDVLQIKIWPDVQLGGEFPIEETGLVYLPILGPVKAAGRSVADLRSELRAKYGESMKSPVVTVTPLVRVGVIGAVTRPGVYYVAPTESIMEVVLRAGGLGENARQDKIQLVRNGQTLQFNTAQAIATGMSLTDWSLRSDDWLVVPSGKHFSLTGIYTALQLITVSVVLWNQFSK